jgi:YihY family inner membrane protein
LSRPPGGDRRRTLKKLIRGVSVFFHFFCRRIYNRWNEDHVFFSGASISFNVLVTILPLCVLIFGISSLTVRENTELQEGVSNWVSETNPFIPESIRLEVEQITTERVGIPSLVGFLTLLWLVSRLFGTIRTAFDRIFDVPRGRNIVLGKLYDFLLAILVALCFFAAVFFTALAAIVVDSPVGDAISAWPLIGTLFSHGNVGIIAITFTLLLYFMLYWAAPNRKVSFGQASFATVLATILSSIGTIVYTWAIGLPDWGIVYGSLTRIIATLFWLYWLCVILLGAAEASQVIHEWRRIRYNVRHLRRSGDWVETVAE